VSEIQLSPADTVPAGVYSFSIFVSTGAVESNFKGEYTLGRPATAIQVAHLIARTCLDGDGGWDQPHTVTWLILDQGGSDWLQLDLAADA
jgi:hypothetical protein